MNTKKLTLSLRTALMDRNVCQVRALLLTHGVASFGAALAHCSSRITAEVLRLLKPADRDVLLQQLSSRQRDSLRTLGIALSPETRNTSLAAGGNAAWSLPWGGRRLLNMAF